MDRKIIEIQKKFNIPGRLINIKENYQGNINSTYILTYEENGKIKRYILQKINTDVFKKPYDVMRNINLVTNHLEKRLKEEFNADFKTLKLLTNQGVTMVEYQNADGNSEYYRVYEYIENCISYDSFKDCKDTESAAYNVGKAFGTFHRLLRFFPSEALVETIPDFHNTPKRFIDLKTSLEKNVMCRANELRPEIEEILKAANDCMIIWDKLGKEIPIRVTHNDTKLNNVMMDKDSHKGVAVIDYDTIMPGSILFDIGDGIRSACSNAFEDETNPALIFLNVDLAKAYLTGFLEEMGPYMTEEEIRLIPLAIKTITFELAIRFLTDYLNGDKYFKIKHRTHNKDRFFNQFFLLRDINRKEEELKLFVENYIKGNKHTRIRK